MVRGKRKGELGSEKEVVLSMQVKLWKKVLILDTFIEDSSNYSNVVFHIYLYIILLFKANLLVFCHVGGRKLYLW